MAQIHAGVEDRDLDAGAAARAGRHLARDQAPGGAEDRRIELLPRAPLPPRRRRSSSIAWAARRKPRRYRSWSLSANDEILRFDRLDRTIFGDFVLYAQPKRMERIPADHGRPDLREDQRLGIADVGKRHCLIGEVTRIGHTQTLRLE